MSDNSAVLISLRQWLDEFVIGLELCPFAKREYVNDRVRFTIAEARQESELLATLYDELNWLVQHDEVATTLLVHPDVLLDFGDFNQFLDRVDELLAVNGWLGEFQVASFHPAYQFANTEVDDAENYTNRSPYPVLHILREHMVEAAVSHYPDIEAVPLRNVQLMKELGVSKLKFMLNELGKH